MSIEPAPYLEAHEPNTKKKLQSAIEFAMDQKPEGLAGLIMRLPGNVKGLPSDYASYNHPVVILSPSMSVDYRVEILGMTSFSDRDLTRRFDTSSKGMRKRAKYLPIEPTPPHPDTPERNVMLKVLPYNPKKYSYVDTSTKSRTSVPFSVLKEYFPPGSDHSVYIPRFYLDKDSYQKLAAFVGFSNVALFYTPADPEVKEERVDTDELESPLLPSHVANIPQPVMNRREEPVTTQTPGATEPPVPIYSQPTPPVPSDLLDTSRQSHFVAFIIAANHDLASRQGARNALYYDPCGPLKLSKPARNNIRRLLAFVATLTAIRALSRSTVGREVLKEAVAGVKAMMLAGASKKLPVVISVIGVLAKMAWAVVKHSGRNWERYTMAGLSALVVQLYDERYPGGRGFKLDQILMLVWDVACLRIVE